MHRVFSQGRRVVGVAGSVGDHIALWKGFFEGLGSSGEEG